MVSHSDSGKLEHGAVFLILEMITQPSSSFTFLLTKDSDQLFDFRQIKQAKIELEVSFPLDSFHSAWKCCAGYWRDKIYDLIQSCTLHATISSFWVRCDYWYNSGVAALRLILIYRSEEPKPHSVTIVKVVMVRALGEAIYYWCLAKWACNQTPSKYLYFIFIVKLYKYLYASLSTREHFRKEVTHI